MSKQEDFDKFVKNTADAISHQWGTDGLTYADLVGAGDKCVEYGYRYAVDKACELIEKLCDSHNIVSIKDGKYKSRSWLEEQFRKGMQ